MKKIFAILGAVLVLASCSKDIDSTVVMTASEGAMRLGVAMQSDAVEEDVVIKIYKVEGQEQNLVRRYEAIGDVPEYLSLLQGDYVVKVQVGQKSVASFDHKYYLGEESFTIEAGNVASVTVDCKLQNSIVKVNYDATVAEKLEAGYFTNVSIAESYNADAIATGDIHSLRFDDSKEGYFILPEGETSLFWHFEGTHPVEGEIVKEAVIENVKPAAKYTITLKYSKDAPGNLVLEATVDESIEEVDDTLIFSPDPTVMGNGFNEKELQLSITERTYNVSALANITTLTLNDHDLLAGGVAGVSVAKGDDMNYQVTISSAFFATYVGGAHDVMFHVEDADGGKLNKAIGYNVQGIMALSAEDYSLWFGTATFKANIVDAAATSVKIAYSADGASWTEMDAVAMGNGIYTAQSTDFACEKSYTYKLIVGGVEYGKTLALTTAAGAQIPNGDMERWHTASWVLPYGKGDTPFWLTGNEGGAMVSATLTQSSDDVRPGSAGTKSAYLKSQYASMMGIGKFAAGNLFTGTFALNGMDGMVTFGRDFAFTAKPKSMSFWLKNNEGTIDQGSHASGTDIMTIMVIITDGTSYTVNTKDESSFLKMEDLATKSGVIAYGYITGSHQHPEWTEKTIDLIYREDMKNIKPKKLVVSFTPSGYGDYFCGSTNSWMYVDDIVLNY
ncbi:MAG: DUF4493 domain-containing protein [Alistipes sp.]|nr:DUF4493 domain-containing protein [Alistipes sp.]MBO7243647.1 DUF4493 domain-containing protein [Alistipes sp.]